MVYFICTYAYNHLQSKITLPLLAAVDVQLLADGLDTVLALRVCSQDLLNTLSNVRMVCTLGHCFGDLPSAFQDLAKAAVSQVLVRFIQILHKNLSQVPGSSQACNKRIGFE